MDETYLFIDGGYARRVYHRAITDVFGPDVRAEPDPRRISYGNQYFRVFFYDCLDDRPRDGEQEADLTARVRIQEQFFEELRSLRGVHVRLGTLVGKRARQKEVDILLAVDMLTHGFNRNMNRAILLAGDLDFRPVVEALVRAGNFVEIMYEPRSAAKDLFGAADFGIPLEWLQIYNWGRDSFKENYPLPQQTPQNAAGINIVRMGRTSKGQRVILYENFGRYIMGVIGVGMDLYLRHEDAQLLERYCSHRFAPIEWNK